MQKQGVEAYGEILDSIFNKKYQEDGTKEIEDILQKHGISPRFLTKKWKAGVWTPDHLKSTIEILECILSKKVRHRKCSRINFIM